MTGSVLTGSLHRRALKNADNDVRAGLTGHNADNDKRKSPEFAVPESCVQRKH